MLCNALHHLLLKILLGQFIYWGAGPGVIRSGYKRPVSWEAERPKILSFSLGNCTQVSCIDSQSFNHWTRRKRTLSALQQISEIRKKGITSYVHLEVIYLPIMISWSSNAIVSYALSNEMSWRAPESGYTSRFILILLQLLLTETYITPT